MSELRLFEKLRKAFETSTPSNNAFKRLLESIKWDCTFFDDEEFNYVKGEFVFTTPSLDPFDMEWRPCVIFGDGSVKEI